MGSTDLVLRSQQAVAVTDYDRREVIDTIKQTVARGATDAQLAMFLEVCKRTGLNPFLKEVWFVPGVGVMAARDGYLRVANEHPQFDGMETRVIREGSKIVKAVCSVYRKDRNHPITCEAYFDEYNKPSSNVWKQYPSAMISKVAEVLALKRSFSINGVVTEEEIGEQQPQPSYEEGRAAQKAVLDAKLAVIQTGAPLPPTEPLTAEEVPEPEHPAGTPTKAQVGKGKADPNWFKKMVSGFEALKAEIGRETYYRILGTEGYEHANQLPNRETALKVYHLMADERKRLQEENGPLFGERPDGTLAVPKA